MTIELGALMSVASVVIALFAAIVGYQTHQFKKANVSRVDVKRSASEGAELKAELGYIRKGVDDIRIDLKANEKQMAALGERVTRVEESSKQAHKRIDKLEGGEKEK